MEWVHKRPFYSWKAETPDPIFELKEVLRNLSVTQNPQTEVKALRLMSQQMEVKWKRLHFVGFLVIFLVPLGAMFIVSLVCMGSEGSTLVTLNKVSKAIYEFEGILATLKIERDSCINHMLLDTDSTENALQRAISETRQHMLQVIWSRDKSPVFRRTRTPSCSNVSLSRLLSIYTNLMNQLFVDFNSAIPELPGITFWKQLLKYQQSIFTNNAVETELKLLRMQDPGGGVTTLEENHLYHKRINIILHGMADHSLAQRVKTSTHVTMDILLILKLNTSERNLNASWAQTLIDFRESHLNTPRRTRDDFIKAINTKTFNMINYTATSSLLLIISLIFCCLAVGYIRCTVVYFRKYREAIGNRMKELTAQTQRKNSVLRQVIPPLTIKNLGKEKVNVEFFNDVTLLFADIHGVPSLVSKCSPKHVVSIMNGLFTLMDERIERYDAYRMEVVGDSYMVSSGVPSRNGNKHVSEIANLALDLVNVFSDIEVIYSPESLVTFQLGIHTGPCIAALFGAATPRYRLIGETVGIASRMELTGLPNKIQLSSTSQAFLNPDDYLIRPRGLVDIEGRRKIMTYWLIGRSFADRRTSRAGGVDFEKNRRESIGAWSSVTGSNRSECFGSRMSIKKISGRKQSIDERKMSTFFKHLRYVNQEIPTIDDIASQYEGRKGSPVILQLTEGIHY